MIAVPEQLLIEVSIVNGLVTLSQRERHGGDFQCIDVAKVNVPALIAALQDAIASE